MIVAAVIWLALLVTEKYMVVRARRRLSHVIHVNGTRGKSTVSRLIDAGLRAGGKRVFCKTTGTDPMIIDVSGNEETIVRRGPANIREQIHTLIRAAREDADILVIECMALQPELQHVSQHDILSADIGVITNVRYDHEDVMGSTLEEIEKSLSNMIPAGGVLFTAEQETNSQMEETARKSNTEYHLVKTDGTEEKFDFPENIALALAVCGYLGVPKETALSGMKNFVRDPFAVSLCRWGEALFVNGLSINDAGSIRMVYDKIQSAYGLSESELILIVNNRADRGYRTRDIISVCAELDPAEIWLLGSAQYYVRSRLRRLLPGIKVRMYDRAADIDITGLSDRQCIYAIGNIKDEGRKLTERVGKEGTRLV